MMTLEDYALDVNKTIDEIKALCDKIGINYEDENSLLNETDIILLDNEQQDEEDYVTPGDEDALEEQRLEEEVEDIAEELALDTKFDLDNSSSFEKVKQKVLHECLRSSRCRMMPERVYHADKRKERSAAKWKCSRSFENYAFSPGEIRAEIRTGAQGIR